MGIILSDKFVLALAEAGIVDDPSRIHRVIIDCKAGEPIQVLVEKYGDDRLLAMVRDGGHVLITEATAKAPDLARHLADVAAGRSSHYEHPREATA